MKIFILGTSNSVMTEGYVKALKIKHEVINFSLGRVPCVYHIKVILEKRQEIEGCDLLIIEHYINDVNRYIRIFGESHFDYCRDLYEILSCLNVNVINVLYPILGMEKHPNKKFYEDILKISSCYKIDVIDLNIKYKEPEYFKDRLHLREDLSLEFGFWLADNLSALSWKKPTDGQLIESSYSFLNAGALSKKSKNIKLTYNNSLVNLEVVHIKKDVFINFDKQCYLIAIGYLKNKEDCHGLIVNNSIIVLSREGYLVELLDNRVDCNPLLELKPLLSKGSFQALGNRQSVTGKFSGAKIVELFFKNNYRNKFISATRSSAGLNLNSF